MWNSTADDSCLRVNNFKSFSNWLKILSATFVHVDHNAWVDYKKIKGFKKALSNLRLKIFHVNFIQVFCCLLLFRLLRQFATFFLLKCINFTNYWKTRLTVRPTQTVNLIKVTKKIKRFKPKPPASHIQQSVKPYHHSRPERTLTSLFSTGKRDACLCVGNLPPPPIHLHARLSKYSLGEGWCMGEWVYKGYKQQLS